MLLKLCLTVSLLLSACSQNLANQSSKADLHQCRELELRAHVWLMEGLSETEQRYVGELIVVAQQRNTRGGTDLSGYEGDSVSRLLRSRLPAGTKAQTPVEMELWIFKRHTHPVGFEKIAVMYVREGRGSVNLPLDARESVLQIRFPSEDVLSPIPSGGSRQLILFPHEWKNSCLMNVSGIVTQPRPVH